jgi:hypothetical protein
MDKESTFGLTIGQLADLFTLGIEEVNSVEDISDNEALTALLRDQLATPLPKDSLLFDSLLTMLGRLGCDLRALAGRSLRDVLLKPGSDIGLLQAIKDYSKKLSCSLASESETAIAITIYYAALASSLLYHDKKITQYSYDSLDESFARLSEKEWMVPELARLFSRARKICRRYRGKK